MKNSKKTILSSVLSILIIISIASGQKYIAESARDIPIAHTVDVLVVGGNSAGLAAAISARKSGSSVLVVSPQENFSYEICSTKRYWLEPGEVPQSALAKKLFADLADIDGNRISGAKPGAYNLLRLPGSFKKAADDALVEAGVSFLYTCYPVGIVEDGGGKIAGIVMANKAGRQIVVAKTIVDATSMAGVARMAGAELTPWKQGAVNVTRTMYDASGITGGNVIGSYHEYTSQATMNTGSWLERCNAQMQLRKDHDETHASWAGEHMYLIEQSAIAGRATDNSSPWAGAKAMDINCCRPKSIDHLFVASSATSMSRANAAKLMRTLALLDLGERVGVAAHNDAKGRSAPTGLKIKTASGTNIVSGVDVGELLDGHRPGRKYQTTKQGATSIPVWGEYDVVVAGGGTAGAPAGIAAARAGAKTLVIDMQGWLGGTGTHGVSTYWRGNRRGFSVEMPLPGKYWVWPHCWKAAWLFKELVSKGGADLWLNTFVCGVIMDGNTVRGVVVATPMGRGAVLAKRVIDATGEGDVCAAAGADFSFMVNEHDLASQEAGYSGDNDISGKKNDLENVFVDATDIYSSTMFRVLSRKYGEHRNRFDFYSYLLIREARFIVGDYTMDISDENMKRRFHDVVVEGKSDYDSHGYFWDNECYMGLFYKGDACLPYRSLLPRGFENILITGKAKSVTRDALPLVRMQADVQNEGYAAGYAAVVSIKDGVTPRKVDIGKVQQHLIAIGNIPSNLVVQNDTPLPTDAELASAAGNPGDQPNLVKLMDAGERSIAPLKASFQNSKSMHKAKVLCVLGDKTTVPYLANWLSGQAVNGSNGQPYFRNTLREVSEVDGVIWALGRAGDEAAVDVLTKKLAGCTNGNIISEDNCFSHVRAIAISLSRIGSSKASAALKAFLDRSGVSGMVKKATDADAHSQAAMVKSMVELYLATALYKCGDVNNQAKNILTNYVQNDWRGPLVRYAAKALGMPIAGSDPVTSPDPLFASLPKQWARIHSSPHGYSINIDLNQAYRIGVYSMDGRQVAVFNGVQPAIYQVSAASAGAGVHVVRISTGTKEKSLRAAVIQ